MNMKTFQILLVTIILTLLFASCNRSVVYEEYYDIPEGGWHQNDPVRFSVSLDDTLNTFDLIFHIRHNVEYNYRNLWVFADIDYPDGTSTRDTVEFIIGDRSGNWLGEGVGKIREDNILLSRNIRFSTPGAYNFAFYQAMREEDQILENVLHVGFTVKAHD